MSVCLCVHVLSMKHSLQTFSLTVGISRSPDLHALSCQAACADVMGGVPFLYERSPVISGGDQLAEQSARRMLLCE